MHPTLQLPGGPVGSYMVMLVVAIGLCAVVGERLSKRFGLSRRLYLMTFVIAVVSGYLMAKGQSILFEIGVAHWLTGGRAGLAIQGGVLGGVLTLVVAARLSKTPLLGLLDLAACLLPLGIAVARLGCLLHGCCYGKPTLFPIALVFPGFDGAARPVGVPLHATQLYLSLVGAATFLVILRRRLPSRRWAGQLTVESLGMLSLGRFLVEFLRADNRGPTIALGMPLTQVVALALCVGTGLVWWRARLTARRATVSSF